MRTKLKLPLTLCLVLVLGLLFAARGQERKRQTPENTVRGSKEQLEGVWRSYSTNGVLFIFAFDETRSEYAEVTLSRGDEVKAMYSQLSRDADDKPFQLGFAEVVLLQRNKLRVSIDRASTPPSWVPCEAILEKVRDTKRQLLRIWLDPRVPVRERAEAVNRTFTNGTPMSVVVAALGTNYIQCFSSARVWLGPGPEPPNNPSLSYPFGEEEVTIHTSTSISEGPLTGNFTGAGYSLPVGHSTRTTDRIWIGGPGESQPDG
jgi:hypothetical protein